MTAAIIGLVGALLGALTTLLGTLLTDGRQTRREEAKWRRDQRAAAYDGTLRHLLRAANLRSEFMGGGGMAVLRQEHQRDWFDDLVNAQFWLHQLIHYCDRSQLDSLQATAARLDLHIARLISAESYDAKGFSILEVLKDCIADVTASARAENGDNLAVSRTPVHPQSEALAGKPSADRPSQIVMSSHSGTPIFQHADHHQINIAMEPSDPGRSP